MDSETHLMIIIMIRRNQCKGRKSGAGGISQAAKRKGGLTLLLPSPEEREIQHFLAMASPDPSGTMCSVAGLEVERGDSHLASPFR